MTSRKRTVLTTGANSGIGLATALRLAAGGHRSIGSVRSEAKAEALARAAREAGVEVETVLLDVDDADQCADVIARVKPEALVNNAGYGMSAAIEDADDAAARALLETLLVAPMRLARLSLPHMRERGGGRIVNMSSILGRVSLPFTGWYQAAKHGLEAATDALRMEVAGDGIKVVLVEPGLARTSIFDDMEADAARYQGSRYDDAYRRNISALRRSEPLLADPDRVAAVVRRAVEARLPRPRYLVGNDARMLAAWQPLVPDVVRDRIVRTFSGL